MVMESLEDTDWDAVISGTSLPQSLLALALSRSGQKILHVDKNEYYGGTEAALSLQEIDAWVEKVNDATQLSAFRNAILTRIEQEGESSSLGFSRAYSISLSPQLIYTRSNLLPALVSSKVHSQLEFLAVGNWWVFNHASKVGKDSENSTVSGYLHRIPGGREDVFSDKSLDLRATRALMKFLKLAADAEAHGSILEEWGSRAFSEYLSTHLSMPSVLQAPLLALASSSDPPSKTLTSQAIPRIHRHLTSIGLFGPGFGLVLPKWGCLSEIAQVGCRAGAVGGGVYILNKAVESVEPVSQQQLKSEERSADAPTTSTHLNILLEGGERLKGRWLVGSIEDLPQLIQPTDDREERVEVSHSVTIVSSALPSIFHLPAEGAPPPAATVVFFPSGSLAIDDLVPAEEMPPVYITVHSSDTGECPVGQCIIYAQTSLPQPHASSLLTVATNNLLSSITTAEGEPKPSILWTLHYARLHRLSTGNHEDPSPDSSVNPHLIHLPSIPPGLALDDSVLRSVREAWATINGEDDGSFMIFEERGSMGDEGEEGSALNATDIEREEKEDLLDGD